MKKSDKNAFVSNEVNNKIDLELQILIWNLNELLKEKRKDKMDYIQWFDIIKSGDNLVINNKQYNPMREDKLKIIRKNFYLNNTTIVIIEGVSKQVMLTAAEYKSKDK